MFNNLIYFIVVLLIFSISYPDPSSPISFTIFLFTLCGTWFVFALVAFFLFRRLLRHIKLQIYSEGGLTRKYHSTVNILSIVAILIFALDVFVLNLKFWIQKIPGFAQFSLLEGLAAVLLFLAYLATIWFFSYQCYKAVFGAPLKRWPYVAGQIRFNFPVLFPWIALSLAYDALEFITWPPLKNILMGIEGQIIFFVCFLGVLMTFMPRWIQYWWGCKPLEPSGKVGELEKFLKEKKFRYREMMRWPIFEGRALTAGIMGIVPRYRYILITDALLEVLNVDELKAVLAHEMGHAKYKHLLFYLVFFVGFMSISYGLFDIFFFVMASQPYFLSILTSNNPQGMNVFYMALSIPMLFTLIIYFRYIMGFFMRNFERQADLYSATVMGTPKYTIDSLEKIALWSGKSRDVPSWHHFSIRERVECLQKMFYDKNVAKRHNRFVAITFIGYLALLSVLSYRLDFAESSNRASLKFFARVLEQRVQEGATDIALYQNLAMIYQELGQSEKAEEAYEKIIQQDPDNAVALNNLAWLLVTKDNPSKSDKQRALNFALRAVALERNPVYLDTLAEVYFAVGRREKALSIIKEALSKARENKDYYMKQLEKFQKFSQ